MFSNCAWVEPKRIHNRKETILSKCWTPCVWYTNMKNASYACLAYTVVIHLIGISYAGSVIGGDRSAEFYSPFFELDGDDMLAATSLFIIYMLFFIGFGVLLGIGLHTENRLLFWPWLSGVILEILIMFVVGIWFIVGYWMYLYSVFAAIVLWCFCAFHVYLVLCVASQYQLLRDAVKIEVLYPDWPEY